MHDGTGSLAGGMLLLEERPGFYWEVHLNVREVNQIDGSRDVEKRYGTKTP
jgi:hypothetical protein